jgi:hypothetical protein
MHRRVHNRDLYTAIRRWRKRLHLGAAIETVRTTYVHVLWYRNALQSAPTTSCTPRNLTVCVWGAQLTEMQGYSTHLLRGRRVLVLRQRPNRLEISIRDFGGAVGPDLAHQALDVQLPRHSIRLCNNQYDRRRAIGYAYGCFSYHV